MAFVYDCTPEYAEDAKFWEETHNDWLTALVFESGVNSVEPAIPVMGMPLTDELGMTLLLAELEAKDGKD